MRKIIIFLLILSTTKAYTQEVISSDSTISGKIILPSSDAISIDTDGANTNKTDVYRKNIFKINLSSFAFHNNSISYERLLSRKVSFVAGYRFMPEVRASTSYIGKKVLEKYGNNSNNLKDNLNSTIIGNTTYTGEFRFYGGKKPGARGFYLSLYGRYMALKTNYAYEYVNERGTYVIPLAGTIKGIAGGLMIGSQWQIKKRITLDWYILGGHYGKLNGTLNGITDLKTMSEENKRELRENIESFNEELNGKVVIKATVKDQGVGVEGTAPFIGIRGLGFNIGIAF